MVSPINYTTNVLNPIEGYMQGLKFGEGILGARQGRELAQSQEERAQETFAMQKEDRARAIQRQQAAAAQAQAQREQAARGQQALLEYLDKQEAGTATPSDLRRAMVQFPQVSERFQAVASSFSQEKLANETQFGQQLSFALGRGNTDAAQSLIQERLDAATASGDERGAAAYQSQLKMLETSPEALLTETLMPLVSTMPVDDFDKFYKAAVGNEAPDQPAEVRELQFRAQQGGLVQGTPEYQEFMRTGGAVAPAAKLGFRAATPAEAAAFGAPSGQIDQDSGRFYPFNPPKGMSLTVDKDGNISFVEGAVAGVGTGKKTTDYVYTTSETGEQIARPIAGTPAALEAQEKRSGLQARSDTAINMLATIESVVGRPAGNGLTAVEADPALPGILGLIEGRLPAKTEAQSDLMAKYEQITGRAFLEAFETLKGGGQITETEGIKATQALGRLQRTQSVKAFKESLYEFADIVRKGLVRSQNELATIPEIAPASATTQPSDVVLEVGEVVPAAPAAVNVITREEFIRDPSIINLDPDLQESVWLKYKKIKGIE